MPLPLALQHSKLDTAIATLGRSIERLMTPMEGEADLLRRLDESCRTCQCRHCGGNPKS